MVQLHLVPIKISSSAGLLISPTPLSPKHTHTLALWLAIHWLAVHPNQRHPPAITARYYSSQLALACIAKHGHWVYLTTTLDLCCCTAHKCSLYRYPYGDRNKCWVSKTEWSLTPTTNTSVTQQSHCSLLGLTDRNTVGVGRGTRASPSPSKAQEDCAWSYSTQES